MRNTQKVSVYNSSYRANNKEKVKALQDKYYKDHREARIENARKWAKEHPEQALATRRAYMQTPRGRLTSIKGSAGTRGISYGLVDEKALQILKTPCFYCGDMKEIGIDRIDSSIGYQDDNCVSCCCMCNYMKRVYSLEEFISKCKAIAKKHS